MSIILSVNSIIRPRKSEEPSEMVRVLWFSETQDAAYLIPIVGDKGLPYFVNLSLLKDQLTSGEQVMVTDDPWARAVEDEELSGAERESRDKAWKTIESLVADEMEPSIYDKRTRGPLVQDAARANELSAKIVYLYLRKYWQRGKTKNSLLPDYDKRGGRGKEKAISDKKRGRPGKYPAAAKAYTQVNVDEATKRVIRITLNRHYLNNKETALRKAYDLMIKDFYQEDFYFDDDGVQKSILISPDQKPSWAQFRYWAEKMLNPEKAVTARKGKVVFSKDVRPHLGDSTTEASGPGEKCQIDATVADVYIRSRYNREWIIGRPVIYVLIDVFSRMIVGLYVGLEGPSWIGAMMTLVNAATNKSSYLKKFGINTSEQEWPCEGLPSVILSDGGEVKSAKAESLTANLDVKFQTAKAYAPDWKGIVESRFRLFHEKVKPFVPGFVEKNSDKRIGTDYRLDAKLDIFQFTKVMISCVRHHNRAYLSTYSRNEQMIAEDVASIPTQLWEWGIINRGNKLKKYNQDIVKLNVMPTADALITGNGIFFEKMRYSCEKAIREQWFERANLRGNNKIKISYDPRTTNYIYIKAPDGKSYEKCYLLDSGTRYSNRDIYEIQYLHQYESQNKLIHAHQQQQNNVNLAEEIEHVVREAELQTAAIPITQSKREALSDMRLKRAVEKQRMRDIEAFDLPAEKENEDLPKELAKVLPLKPEPQVERRAFPSNIELLRQKKKEMKENKNDR